MAQNRKLTRNNKKPLGRSNVLREDGTLSEEALNKATNSKKKGGRYQACLSKEIYIHMKANKTIRAPRYTKTRSTPRRRHVILRIYDR